MQTGLCGAGKRCVSVCC